jgi:hypothetical protein
VRNRISYGEDWANEITGALEQAGLVLVFWSQYISTGHRRDQFLREVRRGLERGILVQALLDRSLPDGRDIVSVLDPKLRNQQLADLSSLNKPLLVGQRIELLTGDLRRRLSKSEIR